MSEVIRGWWACVYSNDRLICVETYSGYRGGTDADYKGTSHCLDVGANDAALGEAVLGALGRSRWVLGAARPGSIYPPDVEFDDILYDRENAAERYGNWVDMLMVRYGYKTKRTLFEGMMSCPVERRSGTIKIRPTHHVKLEAWEGSEADTVCISESSTPAEIGAALRLALSRCT